MINICNDKKNGDPWGNEPPAYRGYRYMLKKHKSEDTLFIDYYIVTCQAFLTRDIKKGLALEKKWAALWGRTAR
jgi:hypothetical protein